MLVFMPKLKAKFKKEKKLPCKGGFFFTNRMLKTFLIQRLNNFKK